METRDTYILLAMWGACREYRSCNNTGCVPIDGCAMTEESRMNVLESKVKENFILCTWLDTFPTMLPTSASDVEVQIVTRSIIMHLMGKVLMPNMSGSRLNWMPHTFKHCRKLELGKMWGSIEKPQINTANENWTSNPLSLHLQCSLIEYERRKITEKWM